VAVGADVQEVQLGDRVMAPFTACCGKCYFCSSGATCRCSHKEVSWLLWVNCL
jgi:Zn-dependent alcohol dehydrogenase